MYMPSTLSFGIHQLDGSWHGSLDGVRWAIDGFAEQNGFDLGWEDKGILHVAACGVEAVELPVAEGRWIKVQIRGAVCESLGLARVLELYHCLCVAARFEATRVDWAVDGVPFQPLDFREWITGGCLVSKHFKAADWRWYASPTGYTCYLGWDTEKRKRKGDLLIRVYDMRGPTRFELEMHGGWAKAVMMSIGSWRDWGAKMDRLSDYVRACIGGLLDFQIPGHGRKVAWEQFVGTQPIRLMRLSPPERRPSVRGWFDEWVRQNKGALALLDAAGAMKGLLSDAVRKLNVSVDPEKAQRLREALGEVAEVPF
jgi:hypothetical protein